MQDRVGAAADRLEVDLSGRGMEQGQDLAGATPDILVRLHGRMALWPPTAAQLRHRLERTSLVLAPDCQAERGAERVGPLDQPLFAAAFGSVTVTGPVCLRLRTTTPVSHQLRPFCQLYPAACRARPTVWVLIPGRPSSARRSASRSVVSDQVAVPSRVRSGVRATSARMRRCSASP